MRRAFLAFTIILALSFVSFIAWAAPGDSADDPIFISTPAELDNIRNGLNKYYKLSADIDLTAYLESGGAGYAKWGVSGWQPIGTYADNNPSVSFSGSFDGDGHKITGLWINRRTAEYVGLFGCASADIKNVGVEIASSGVIGFGSVGGLMGRQIGGSIVNTYATGAVSGEEWSAGGLVGSQRGSIDNSYATCAVSGDWNVGGLVGGQNSGASITNSCAMGVVSGNNYVGGLVGGQGVASIDNSYATGAVSGKGNNVGGLVGQQKGSIDNSYATGAVSGDNAVGGLVGEQDGSIESSYATGAISGSGNNVGGLVGLQNRDSSIENSYATGAISGSSDYVGGLVGEQNGSIDNSYAAGVVSGRGNNVGGLVGQQSGGSIANTYATGAISGSNYQVGGLVGRQSGSIESSYATGVVSGDNYVGGLVGEQDSGSSIESSYATGVVSGDNEVGGLVGRQSGVIDNSYSTGNVSGSNMQVGGLVGRQNSGASITNSCAMGVVSGYWYVGGLAGWQYGSIENSYATGNISGNDRVGGLVGAQASESSIINSYRYQSVTVNGAVRTENTPNGFQGGIMTSADLMTKSTYTGNFWLFNDSAPTIGPWHWDERGFPKLNIGTEPWPWPWQPLFETPNITIAIQPVANTTFAEGGVSGVLSITATVTPIAELSYQWHSNATNNNTDGEPIPGASSSSFTISANLTAGAYYYYCVVGSPGATPVTSNVAIVTVTTAPMPGISIITQPAANTIVAEGDISGVLSITATVLPSADLSYQWHSNTTNNNTDGESIPGATNSSFPIPINLEEGIYYYYCVVGSPGVAPVTSNVARVTVEPVTVEPVTDEPAAGEPAKSKSSGGCNATGYGAYLIIALLISSSFVQRK